MKKFEFKLDLNLKPAVSNSKLHGKFWILELKNLE